MSLKWKKRTGFSSPMENSVAILAAGLAEVAAGATAMGLGGSMAGRTDIEHFASERAREEGEAVEVPHRETAEVGACVRRENQHATSSRSSSWAIW